MPLNTSEQILFDYIKNNSPISEYWGKVIEKLPGIDGDDDTASWELEKRLSDFYWSNPSNWADIAPLLGEDGLDCANPMNVGDALLEATLANELPHNVIGLSQIDREQAQYFLIRSGIKDGPFSLTELKLLWRGGDLKPGVLFWSNARNDWSPLEPLMVGVNDVAISDIPPIAARKAVYGLFPSFSFSPVIRPIIPPSPPKAEQETKKEEFNLISTLIGWCSFLAILAAVIIAVFVATETVERVFVVVVAIIVWLMMAALDVQANRFIRYIATRRTQKNERQRAEKEALLPADPFERAWGVELAKQNAQSPISDEEAAKLKEAFLRLWEAKNSHWRNFNIRLGANTKSFADFNGWEGRFLARCVYRQFTNEFPGTSVIIDTNSYMTLSDTVYDLIKRETNPHYLYALERLLVLVKEASKDARFAAKEFFADSNYLEKEAPATAIRGVIQLADKFGWPEFNFEKCDIKMRDYFLARIEEIESAPNNPPEDPLDKQRPSAVGFTETWYLGIRTHEEKYYGGIRFDPPTGR